MLLYSLAGDRGRLRPGPSAIRLVPMEPSGELRRVSACLFRSSPRPGQGDLEGTDLAPIRILKALFGIRRADLNEPRL